MASLSPLFASALNDRSLSPPMSVTRPTRSFLPAACVEVVPDPPPAEDELLSLLPQAATANIAPIRPTARIDRDIPFLNTFPHLPVRVKLVLD